MRTNRTPVTLLVTALTVALIAFSAPPAAAQSSKPTTKPGASKASPPTSRALPSDPRLPPAVVNSWALTPTGAQPGEPGTRPNLSYELTPGAMVQDSVTLFNYSNVQLTFHVYATDAFNNADGQFDLLTGEKTPLDAGSWVTLPQANVTLSALASATLPITVAVPPDARPGDHAAAILASSQAEGTGPDGKVIALDRRTGSRMYVRVSGPLIPKLDVEKINSTYHAALNPLKGTVDVEYTVRNRGNLRLAASPRVAVLALFGIGLNRQAPVDVPELLPGNAVTLHATFSAVPATFVMLTTIALKPTPPRDTTGPSVRPISRAGRTLAIPWSILALLLALGLGLFTRRAYRRHHGAASTNAGPRGSGVAPSS